MNYIAGPNGRVALIGSRKAPESVIDIATAIGRKLAKDGVEMFSGGAMGMDSAFENGYKIENRYDLCNIILPRRAFNGKVHDEKTFFCITENYYHPDLLEYADELIQEIHPCYKKLDGFSYWAHMRNCFQILGHDLKSPVNGVIYWAPFSGNEVYGGTRTVVMLAREFGIPQWNMANPEDMKYLNSVFDLSHGVSSFI